MEESGKYRTYLENKYKNPEAINRLIDKKVAKMIGVEAKPKNKLEIPTLEPTNKVGIPTLEPKKILVEKASGENNRNYKSTGTAHWSIFRSREYAKYKEQTPKDQCSYFTFAKMAGYVWSILDQEERERAVNEGWGGDWSKVKIK